jgi:hypothetical protein
MFATWAVSIPSFPSLFPQTKVKVIPREEVAEAAPGVVQNHRNIMGTGQFGSCLFKAYDDA